jgi:hypothetical protein
MTTATQPAQALTVPLEQIYVPDNVRELDPAHVSALAGSISLQGVLVAGGSTTHVSPAWG